jgi:hypothetical protein
MDVENQELGSFSPVSNPLVLAAIQRAQRHSREQVSRRLVAEHLGFVHSPVTSRRLRPQLESLQAAGSLERTRKFGQDRWALTPTGRRRLAAARRAGKVGELPESPQHREWRHAREEAGKQFDGFRGLVYAVLDEAYAAATSPTGASSDQWFAFSERLRCAFWLLGSATYCLDEWPEPDDARADRDEDLPAGRRTWDWDEYESLARGDSPRPASRDPGRRPEGPHVDRAGATRISAGRPAPARAGQSDLRPALGLSAS